jgi:uncharacterized protein (TIGR02145 family)
MANKKRVKLIVLLFTVQVSIFTIHCYSQVSINATGNPPDHSAILDISASDKGMLINRMTTEQRNAIVSPAISLLIFNLTTNCFEAYVNGSWYSVSCPAGCTPPSAPIASPASNVGCTSFTANWNTSSGATAYYIDVSIDSGFTNFVSGYNNLSTGNSSSVTVLGLTKNTSYYYRVRAGTDCTSLNSNPIMVTTASDCGVEPTCGLQIWASANLNSGIQISTSTEQTTNQKWCYNDMSSNCDTYGGLYEWNDLMLGNASVSCDPCGPATGHGGVRGMCPAGYHIPTNSEWSRYEYCVENFISPAGNTPLATFQNAVPGNDCGSSVAGVGPGDKMKVTSTNTPSWDGTNTSGFGALPGGRYYFNGNNIGMGTEAMFWTSTEYNSSTAYERDLTTGDPRVFHGNMHKANYGGASVRCLKD